MRFVNDHASERVVCKVVTTVVVRSNSNNHNSKEDDNGNNQQIGEHRSDNNAIGMSDNYGIAATYRMQDPKLQVLSLHSRYSCPDPVPQPFTAFT